MRIGNRTTRALAMAALALALAPAARADFTVEAFDNATVLPGGPRTGGSGKNFFNVEGGDNGNFASYGVADFAATMESGVNVVGLSLAMTQSNASFTAPGALRFFLSTDTTTSINNDGTSPLVFDAASLPNGLGSQLATLYDLGTGMFTGVDTSTTGTVDTFDLTLSSAAATYLAGQVAAGGTIRIVVAPDDATVAATYAGFSNNTYDGPTLTVRTQAVPEPASIALVGLGGLALLAARRRARG